MIAEKCSFIPEREMFCLLPVYEKHISLKLNCLQIEAKWRKDNKQCLSDTPRWSMKKMNIKNTKAIQNG